MKRMALFFFFVVATMKINAQDEYIGQSKNYIINDYSEYQILNNNDSILTFNYCGMLHSFYFLDGSVLCNAIVCEMTTLDMKKEIRYLAYLKLIYNEQNQRYYDPVLKCRIWFQRSERNKKLVEMWFTQL